MTPITHYESSKGPVEIATMVYSHLVNAINKRARDLGGGTDETLDALRAELARRPPPAPGTEEADRSGAGEREARRADPARPLARESTPAPGTQREIGHNRPPEINAGLDARLKVDHAELLDRAADLEIEASRLPKSVDSDDDLAAVNAWLLKVQNLKRDAEKLRVDEKAEYLKAGKTIDAFFGGVATSANARAAGVQARVLPYLQAKAAAEQRRRENEAAVLRKAEQEARQREQAERDESARLRQVADNALTALKMAQTPEDIEQAEATYREAARAAHLSDEAAGQAAKDAKAAGKVADRNERIVAGEHRHVLGRDVVGGGASTLKASFKPDVHNGARLTASLGPLAPYLGDAAIDAALAKAAKADPRPSIPGVDWVEDHQVQTRAAAR